MFDSCQLLAWVLRKVNLFPDIFLMDSIALELSFILRLLYLKTNSYTCLSKCLLLTYEMFHLPFALEVRTELLMCSNKHHNLRIHQNHDALIYGFQTLCQILRKI